MKETKRTKNKTLSDILPLAIAEGIAVAIIIGVCLLLGGLGVISFDFTLVLGALLGFAVIIGNYIFLTLSVNRAVDNYLALRGTREMDEEEAEKFASENSAPIQNAIKSSFIIRTITMLAALVVAFLTEWFNPITTAIPLLLFRPLLHVIELIRKEEAK